ncbi:class I SAM-dependent methyltransferase [bacterium]|nr:class I SAM-dependent methyltransferase [bacterium]
MNSNNEVLQRYSGAEFGLRQFLRLRWMLTPYSRMIQYLPQKGTIVDLGCGHGLLSLAVALERPECQVLGVDHDPKRLALASEASKGVGGVRYEEGSMSDVAIKEPVDAITIIDALHYFAPEEQERMIARCRDALKPGGTLLIREVDRSTGVRSIFNRAYERVAKLIKFTRSVEESAHYRQPEEWGQLLKRLGFEANWFRCSHPLFADVLFVARRSAL